MIAERRGIAADAAYGRLRAYARNHNLRLADVARRTIDGTLDPSAIAPARP